MGFRWRPWMALRGTYIPALAVMQASFTPEVEFIQLKTQIILLWYLAPASRSRKNPLSGIPRTFALGASVASTVAQWSTWRKVASPPAEQPETTTSVPAASPRLPTRSPIIALRTCLPRNQSVVLDTAVEVAFEPENEPPSQYRRKTAFLMHRRG